MLGDLSGAESTKLICDVSEAIKRELDILIVPLWTLRDVVSRFLALVTCSLLVVMSGSFIIS